MQDLSALTPPLLVCAVVIIAIVAFLRHEMGRSRGGEPDHGEDISAAESDHGEDISAAESDHGEDISAAESDHGEDLEYQRHDDSLPPQTTRSDS